MKKYFFLAIAALGMMAGCQKQEINGGQIDDSSKVAVKFNVDAPSLTLTKGAGPVEEWKSQEIYLLGYERGKEFNTTPLIPNIKTSAPAANTSGSIEVKHPAGSTYAGQPYFYGNGVYDFYGYYIDDAATVTDGTPAELASTAAGASIAITIDGTQDIMAAKADPEWDTESGAVTADKAYSAYAARRNVHPTLTFQHMLTCFNFFVVAGSESGTKVKVQGISIDSYENATLNIAPENSIVVAATEQKVDLALAGIEDAQRTPYATADFKYNTETLIAGTDGKIGNSIMAIAGEESHKIVLATVHANPAITQPIEPLEITLNAADIVTKTGAKVASFEAGKQYDVILTVYGPEEVKITAVLSEWEEGGNTVLDPEADWNVEPEAASASLAASTATSLTFDIVTPDTDSNVKAELYAEGNAEPVGVKEVVPTKAKTATVTFEGLSPVKHTLKLYSKTSETEYAEVEGAAVVDVVPSAITITGAWYVHDRSTYDQLPQSYIGKPGYSWNEYVEHHAVEIPWLAVTVLPMDEDAVITVNDKDVNFKLDAGKTLITIAKEEIADFTGFEAGKTYTVKLTTASGSASAEIVTPAETFEVTKAYLVEDNETSYNQLPESYRIAKGSYADYTAGHADALPWLAVEFTPGKPVSITVKNGATVKNFYVESTTIGLYTFCARELGLETLTPGDWTIIVNGIVKKVNVPDPNKSSITGGSENGSSSTL